MNVSRWCVFYNSKYLRTSLTSNLWVYHETSHLTNEVPGFPRFSRDTVEPQRKETVRISWFINNFQGPPGTTGEGEEVHANTTLPKKNKNFQKISVSLSSGKVWSDPVHRKGSSLYRLQNTWLRPEPVVLINQINTAGHNVDSPTPTGNYWLPVWKNEWPRRHLDQIHLCCVFLTM